MLVWRPSERLIPRQTSSGGGGEGLAKRKGAVTRWVLKEAWSKVAT
jgi:hypothetical protein